MWEAEGEVSYLTAEHPPGDQQHGKVFCSWKVPLVTDPNRGNWSHTSCSDSLKMGIEGGNGPIQVGEAPHRGSPTQANDAEVKYVVFQ